MSYEFVIEQDVPLPPKHIGTAPRPPKYPFAEMSVGESFAVPLGEEKAGSNYVSAIRLRSAATNFKKRHTAEAFEFTVRTLHDEGVVRVWRTA